MAKKSKNSKAFRDRLSNLSEWFRGSERFSHSLTGVLAGLVFVAVVGVGVFGLKYLDDYVNRLAVFTSSEVSVCLFDQPKWMSDSLAKEILTESFNPLRDQLIRVHREGKDPELPRILAQQLATNPWVSKVRWIRRSYGGQFVISAAFRQPTAVVNLDRWSYLIDDAGYLLPGKYKYEAVRDCGMLEIQGVTGTAPAAGKLWASDDLQAGLKLVKLIDPLPFKPQIRAVDVSNYLGRVNNATPWILLVTDRNTLVRWGKPIGQEHGLEITAAQKFAKLAGIYKQYGHIDSGRQYVDIRRDLNLVDRSVIAATQTPAQDE